MTDTEVKINGKLAGPIHQGAFYRFKYNISDKLDFGKDNLLEVTVSKMSADKSVNNAERLGFSAWKGLEKQIVLHFKAIRSTFKIPNRPDFKIGPVFGGPYR